VKAAGKLQLEVRQILPGLALGFDLLGANPHPWRHAAKVLMTGVDRLLVDLVVLPSRERLGPQGIEILPGCRCPSLAQGQFLFGQRDPFFLFLVDGGRSIPFLVKDLLV
jgi:hypothetical protein